MYETIKTNFCSEHKVLYGQFPRLIWKIEIPTNPQKLYLKL